MKRIVTDINPTPRYRRPPASLRPRLLPRALSILGLTAVIFGSTIATQNSTAAPVGSPYVTTSVNPTLLAQANTTELRQSLERQLQDVLKQIDGYKNQIQKIGTKKRGVQEEIKLLQANIKKAELEIKVIQNAIARLEQRTTETRRAIYQTEKQIATSRIFLQAALRYYYQLSRRSVTEVFLADQRLSDYFNNFVYLQKLQGQINDQIGELRGLNDKLTLQRAQLEDQLQEQGGLLQLGEVRRREFETIRGGRQVVLSQTQREETQVQQQLGQAEKTVAQIRAQIFRLAGGAGPINFGEALRLADLASKATGIRPAFLLAIIDYESKLGKNVGSCKYQQAMKPSEWPIFNKITSQLGLDQEKMLVSCRPWYGWGGAMGPAQFIPSTWIGYQSRVATLTGNNPPSPWNILDAFVAAAVKLTDAGAGNRTRETEWKSAMIYFAGGNWNKSNLKFYGDDVLAIAERFEKDIAIVQKTNQ